MIFDVIQHVLVYVARQVAK